VSETRPTGNSSQYDKQVYMSNDGMLTFGVYNGGFDLVTTPNAYNDGQWHQVVGTQGSAGAWSFTSTVHGSVRTR
jgi:hypothetical protein